MGWRAWQEEEALYIGRGIFENGVRKASWSDFVDSSVWWHSVLV